MIEEALIFSAEHHKGQKRKISASPYIYHPMEVMLIVSNLTDDEEVIAAAVLHDTVEDTAASIEDIGRKFGERVAFLVSCETENKREGQSRSASWKIRKQETVDHMKELPPEVKMITLADKLSNLRSMRRSQLCIGDDIFQHFHNKNKSEHAWYYKSLLAEMKELETYEEYRECEKLIEEIFGCDERC